MITVDTSGLVAAISRGDPHHKAAIEVLESEAGLILIPAGIMAEIAYLLEHRAGHWLLLDFLDDLETGAFTLDCGDNDMRRIQALIRRYSDLRIGYADAAVIACAERRGGRVLTIDRRHFNVVARGEKTITVLPEKG